MSAIVTHPLNHTGLQKKLGRGCENDDAWHAMCKIDNSISETFSKSDALNQILKKLPNFTVAVKLSIYVYIYVTAELYCSN